MAELNTLGAVLKSTYESETDTNAFDDNGQTKLLGVAPVNVLGENIKLTLPVNAAGVLSGLNDATEILPHTDASWTGGDDDLASYEHSTYYKVTADYVEFTSPLYGAYTATATAARCEWRYLEDVPQDGVIHRKFVFAVQSMPNNAKANIGQIHRLSADPVFKLSYTSKTDGTGTYRCLVKKSDGAADTTTTIITGITNGDVLAVEYKYDPQAGTLDFWVVNLTDGTVGSHQETGVISSGFASYSKFGMYCNNAGDGVNTDNMTVRLYKDEDLRVIAPHASRPHGSSTMEGNAVATTLTVASTWYKVAGVTTPASHVTKVDAAAVSNRLLYEGSATQHFHIVSNASFTCSSNNQIIEFVWRVNGATNLPAKIARKVSTGADVGAMSLHADASLATNDYAELFVRNITSAGTTVTVQDYYALILGML